MTNISVSYQLLHHVEITCRNKIIKHFIVSSYTALSLSFDLVRVAEDESREKRKEHECVSVLKHIDDNLKECELVDVDNN